MFKVNAGLNFCNASKFKDFIIKCQVKTRDKTGKNLEKVIVDASAIGFLDNAAKLMLGEVKARLDEDGTEIFFASCPSTVLPLLRAIGFRHNYLTLHSAIEDLMSQEALNASQSQRQRPGVLRNETQINLTGAPAEEVLLKKMVMKTSSNVELTHEDFAKRP